MNKYEHYETLDAAGKGTIGRQKRGEVLSLPNTYLRMLSKVDIDRFISLEEKVLSCEIALKTAIEQSSPEVGRKRKEVVETLVFNVDETCDEFMLRIKDILLKNSVKTVTLRYEKTEGIRSTAPRYNAAANIRNPIELNSREEYTSIDVLFLVSK